MSVFFEGKKVRLRSIKKEDLPRLQNLMGEPETRRLVGEVFPVTEGGMEKFYQDCQETKDRIWMVIEDRETQRLVGETGFLRIFYPWRTADFSLILWDRRYQGQGYGRETAHLMLEYGFNTLNLHRVAIGVPAINKRGVAFWKSLGFREEGRQIEGFFSDGVFSDFVMMFLLEGDYRGRSGERQGS